VTARPPHDPRTSSARCGLLRPPQMTPVYYSVIRGHADLTTPAVYPLQTRTTDSRGSDARSALRGAALRCERRHPGYARGGD
jgi:hypothetical protein